MLDSASGGTFMKKPPDEAKRLIEDIAQNNSQWMVSHFPSTQVASIMTEEEKPRVLAQLEALSKKVAEMDEDRNKYPACGDNHMMYQCAKIGLIANKPVDPEEQEAMDMYMVEDVNYAGDYYWRKHPNFSWKPNPNQKWLPGQHEEEVMKHPKVIQPRPTDLNKVPPLR
ncbi:UNVERIFIED_CONTAM: hypothetical protein ITH36_24550, partial [Salmonella enterica subsp. enterica serovar Weltevreden]